MHACEPGTLHLHTQSSTEDGLSEGIRGDGECYGTGQSLKQESTHAACAMHPCFAHDCNHVLGRRKRGAGGGRGGRLSPR
eukprot:362548-Chlamydomonas_euryale.AAC.13